ncbi:MAG: class I SAM-dependent methyltransferase [Candidatus Rokuibacteriota bacterium]
MSALRVSHEPDTGLSPAFQALLTAEPLGELTALDVGTGWGRLALWLAPRCRRVTGVDRDVAAIEDARRRAAAAGLVNADFDVFDAEAEEYARFTPGLVAAHLCMSRAIIDRAARVLAPGRVLAFVALHADQWRETGRRSRFAYDEDQARRELDAAGFAVEHMDVEREVSEFSSVEQGLAAAIALEEKWKSDGRWFRYIKFLEEGGRTLTRAHLIVTARRR